jgi:hypothetical protein
MVGGELATLQERHSRCVVDKTGESSRPPCIGAQHTSPLFPSPLGGHPALVHLRMRCHSRRGSGSALFAMTVVLLVDLPVSVGVENPTEALVLFWISGLLCG